MGRKKKKVRIDDKIREFVWILRKSKNEKSKHILNEFFV